MQRRVYSFSLAPQDREANNLVQQLKRECQAKGTSFSFMILKALKLLRETEDES